MHLKFEEFWEAFARIAEISSLAPPGSEKGEYNNSDRKNLPLHVKIENALRHCLKL